MRFPATTAAAALVLGAFTFAGCGDTVAGLPAVSMTATGDTALTTLVVTAVSPAPGVVLEDFKGNPVAGVPVTFAVTAGGGTVTGGAAVTNAAGVAIVGSWTLGTKAGANSLTATSPGVSPITFTATGNPGPAALLTIAPTEPITIAVGAFQQISAVVADQYGNVVDRPSFFYSSNNNAIATVSLVGVVKGVSAGNTLITILGAGLERQIAIVIFQPVAVTTSRLDIGLTRFTRLRD